MGPGRPPDPGGRAGGNRAGLARVRQRRPSRWTAAADATACVVGAVLGRELTDVTLVAHSWGGYPATAAAHQLTGRVSKLIFCSALVPARDVPLAAENPAYEQMIRGDIAASPDGTSAITRERASLLIPGAPDSTRGCPRLHPRPAVRTPRTPRTVSCRVNCLG
ncbi:MAG TPA: alpha/beta fold hydrolase [Streptosporangiaceae bacterium]|nr:alpha/beta fold hydrolase [Streptosporangiaceae bacterium]